ncbi:MAG: hypothetical protein WC527_00350 [Candidatus Margulisiibacteriota bacterium]
MYDNFNHEKDNNSFGLLRPKEYTSSVFTIDINSLYKKGIRGFIVDLDDTLIPRPEYRIPFSIYSWIEKVKEHGIKICIVSNGGGAKRVEYISDSLNIKAFLFPANRCLLSLKKPFRTLTPFPAKPR